mmetsp:Transcript_56327/g.163382  ORF Transcript_56327/g.163382 Transcript_56327/m.163382 type:complete len:642 (-) Transcript_56327:137-2062(-)
MVMLTGFGGDKAHFSATSPMEEEVRAAEVESNLRRMCVDLVKPTIGRATRHEGELKEHERRLNEHDQLFKELEGLVQLVVSRSEVIEVIQQSLDDTVRRLRETDKRLTLVENAATERLSSLEHSRELQDTTNKRIQLAIDHMSQDLEDMRTQAKQTSAEVSQNFHQCHQVIRSENLAVRQSVTDLGERVSLLNDEVWGPSEVTDASPASLRRLDMQMKKVQSRLLDALADLTALRKLDIEVAKVAKEQTEINAAQATIQASQTVLRERVEKIGVDVKNDSKQAANKMAAFTASLVKDIQHTFGDDVQALRKMQAEMRSFVGDTKQVVGDMDKSIRSVSRQLEAAMREMRTDIDHIDAKRKKDSKGMQEGLQALQGQLRSSLEAAEATVKGLEHVSRVVGMALQSERVSIALDVQDFVDRKETPYVGVRRQEERPKFQGSGGGRSPRPPKEASPSLWKDGLDPKLLMRLSYQPRQVAFQGSEFDRSQLLALREKLVHAAQQVLMQGPGAAPLARKGGFEDGGIADPLVPALLGANGDMLPAAGRRSAMSGSRPGSRAQPSARGSPMNDGDPYLPGVGGGTTPPKQDPWAPGAGEQPSPRDLKRQATDNAEATHLPALASTPEHGERPRRRVSNGSGPQAGAW